MERLLRRAWLRISWLRKGRQRRGWLVTLAVPCLAAGLLAGSSDERRQVGQTEERLAEGRLLRKYWLRRGC